MKIGISRVKVTWSAVQGLPRTDDFAHVEEHSREVPLARESCVAVQLPLVIHQCNYRTLHHMGLKFHHRRIRLQFPELSAGLSQSIRSMLRPQQLQGSRAADSNCSHCHDGSKFHWQIRTLAIWPIISLAPTQVTL